MRRVRCGVPVAAILVAALVGCSSARTIEEASSVPECARCHGFPPTTTSTGATHPSVATACATCHSRTVGPDGEIIAGGAHQNGDVDVTVPHPLPYVADHTPAAVADIQSCAGCHGSDYGGGYTGVSCNACHASVAASAPDWKTNCTWCHGTRTANVTSATAPAAPPETVVGGGDQTNGNPKVGAHQAHLEDGALARALPCASCHAVPTPAQSLTHFTGNGAPGAISFSALATKGVADAAYRDGTCTVYCHGAGTEFTNPAETRSPVWTASGVACGTCHGLPPASGPLIGRLDAHAFHVFAQEQACTRCHPSPPANRDFHVNGTKDVIVDSALSGPVTISGWSCNACHEALGVPLVHGMPFEAEHTSFALADLSSCRACHGADLDGAPGAPSCNACHQTKLGFGDWQTNCTFCHGTRTQGFAGAPAWLPAPPQTVVVTADQTTGNARVGAHQKHVGNGSALSNGVACAECHPPVADLDHVGGSGTAQISFGPLATNGGSPATMTGGTCANYCHGATLPGSGRSAPRWAPPSALTCGSCHQANPTTGQHPLRNEDHARYGCSVCHGPGFVAGSAVNEDVHIDGSILKDPSLNWRDSPKSCAPACHGFERKSW